MTNAEKKLPDSPLEFLRRANLGEFGNTFRMWESLAQAIRDDYTGDLWVPSKVPGRPPFSLHTKLDRLPVGLERDYYFVELPPSGVQRLSQFRLGSSPSFGLTIAVDFTQRPLREAVKKGDWGYQETGFLPVLRLLSNILEYEDYQDVRDLLAEYESIVIEATNWSRSVGRLKRKLCLWEVRGGKY